MRRPTGPGFAAVAVFVVRGCSYGGNCTPPYVYVKHYIDNLSILFWTRSRIFRVSRSMMSAAFFASIAFS